MFLNFYQLNNKKDSGQCISSSVPFIPKWMGLPRAEESSWACPYAIPDGHGIVKTYFPRDKEDGSHVVVTCLYHLVNLPKLINLGWGFIVSEPTFTSDIVKAAFRHELLEAIGAWICLLIKGGDSRKNFPIP